METDDNTKTKKKVRMTLNDLLDHASFFEVGHTEVGKRHPIRGVTYVVQTRRRRDGAPYRCWVKKKPSAPRNPTRVKTRKRTTEEKEDSSEGRGRGRRKKKRTRVKDEEEDDGRKRGLAESLNLVDGVTEAQVIWVLDESFHDDVESLRKLVTLTYTTNVDGSMYKAAVAMNERRGMVVTWKGCVAPNWMLLKIREKIKEELETKIALELGWVGVRDLVREALGNSKRLMHTNDDWAELKRLLETGEKIIDAINGAGPDIVYTDNVPMWDKNGNRMYKYFQLEDINR